MGRQGKAITLLVPSDVPKWRRMARNLGQGVSLQQLIIDEEALVTPPLASPEPSRTQEYEQNDEQRLVRDRNHFSQGQERRRRTQPQYDSDTASGTKRRQKERVTSATPARTPALQPEGFPLPERPYSGKERDGRRGAGKPSRFRRTTGKHEAHAFAATAPQQRAARRKPTATPVAPARRASASNRSASRSHFSKRA